MAENVSKELIRVKNGRFCRLELELKEGRLSICGTAGRVISRKAGLQDARAYWESFFEDSPEELTAMNERCGTRFRSPRSAARYVLDSDGEFHGLDVVRDDGDQLMVFESGGQIREELVEWFPEVTPLLPWHMNDMRPGCVHQRAENWDERPIDPTKPIDAYGVHVPGGSATWNMLVWVRRDEHPEGLLSYPCPTCGYKYGSSWLTEELPAEVLAQVQALAEATR